MVPNGRRPFDARPAVVTAFLGVLTVVATASNLVTVALREAHWSALLLKSGGYAVALVVATEWVLRREGTGLGAVLPSRRPAVGAVVAFAGGWTVVNGIQVGVGLWLDAPLVAGTLVRTPVVGLGYLAVEFVVVALPEELAFRGYLQGRLVDARSSRAGAALAVLLASVIFAVWHLPSRVIGYGYGPETTAVSLLFVLGHTLFVYAVVYELTGNVVLCALAHAFYNRSLLAVHVDAAHPLVYWSVQVGIPVAMVAAALAYRRWFARRGADSGGSLEGTVASA